MNERVSIYLFCEVGLSGSEEVRNICYGIEEEGIPYKVEEVSGRQYKELSEMASAQSQLEVGIGFDASMRICLHQAKLPENYYLFEQQINAMTDLRAFGANSARLVKGMPFKM